MLISTASMVVKSARKMKKVVATLPASMSEMAALTGSRSWMVQGWRPISATIQPDSEAMYRLRAQGRAAGGQIPLPGRRLHQPAADQAVDY